MKLSDVKQQAIGKYFYENGYAVGKIADIYPSIYRGFLDVETDYGRANFIRWKSFERLLQGKRVRQTRIWDGRACPRFGYNVYEIRIDEKINNEAIWSPGPSPIATMRQPMSGITIEEAMKVQGKKRRVIAGVGISVFCVPIKRAERLGYSFEDLDAMTYGELFALGEEMGKTARSDKSRVLEWDLDSFALTLNDLRFPVKRMLWDFYFFFREIQKTSEQ